jgi:hypothetical protein
MNYQLGMFGGTIVMLITFIVAIGVLAIARRHLLDD